MEAGSPWTHYEGLVDLAAELAERKIGLRSTDGIDTSGTAGKLVFHITAAMAEMERDLTRERTNVALASALKGRVVGRKPVMKPKKLESARKLLASGTRPREGDSAISVSIATLQTSARQWRILTLDRLWRAMSLTAAIARSLCENDWRHRTPAG